MINKEKLTELFLNSTATPENLKTKLSKLIARAESIHEQDEKYLVRKINSDNEYLPIGLIYYWSHSDNIASDLKSVYKNVFKEDYVRVAVTEQDEDYEY